MFAVRMVFGSAFTIVPIALVVLVTLFMSFCLLFIKFPILLCLCLGFRLKFRILIEGLGLVCY